VSKAFTREDDDPGESFTPPRAPLPPGTRNYITPGGAAKINAQLQHLIEEKRNSSTPSPALDSRIQYLQSLVLTFVLVEPTPSDVVRFGSTVHVIQNGSPETYCIVGVDEIDLERDHISWLSPLARALMSHRVGERVTFRAPSGNQELIITQIS
jgi:transcription elongation factor GreB